MLGFMAFLSCASRPCVIIESTSLVKAFQMACRGRCIGCALASCQGVRYYPTADPEINFAQHGKHTHTHLHNLTYTYTSKLLAESLQGIGFLCFPGFLPGPRKLNQSLFPGRVLQFHLKSKGNLRGH